MFLSEALDLLNGKVPYKETSSFYGLLVPLIHSTALVLFGKKLLSIGIITGLAYSTSIWFSYKIWSKFLTKQIAAALTLVLFLLHPNIIYPWPNYFSYMFQLMGILFFITNYPKLNDLYQKKYLFLSGVFFGLSILARDETAISLFATFFLIFLFEFAQALSQETKGRKQIGTKVSLPLLKQYLFVFLGLLTPILIFFLYLSSEGLFIHWVRSAILVKQFFADRISYTFILTPVLGYFYNGLDPIFASSYHFLVSCIFFINVALFLT
ncbi:MAG: glycosyltransferase family 39 protein, partial [SAR324 cluster bacterium]|nr:glycosyltransferase family 39 protein [SAR324 cluster bacterium]